MPAVLTALQVKLTADPTVKGGPGTDAVITAVDTL